MRGDDVEIEANEKMGQEEQAQQDMMEENEDDSDDLFENICID